MIFSDISDALLAHVHERGRRARVCSTRARFVSTQAEDLAAIPDGDRSTS